MVYLRSLGAIHMSDEIAKNLKPGTIFATPFESGCIVVTEPNEDGGFLALDSDKVECWFSVVMVTDIESEEK